MTIVLVVGFVACDSGGDRAGGDSDPDAGTGIGLGGDGPSKDGATEVDPGAIATYGYGALVDPEVTYQPDVVVVEGGPGIIRSARADGLEWVIDGSAPGARDLEVGSVIFATASAVGRVVALREAGDDLAITLAPVELGEVVRDGTISIDQPIDLSLLQYRVIPDLPGALAEPGDIDPAQPAVGGIDASAEPASISGGVGEGDFAASLGSSGAEAPVVLPAVQLVAIPADDGGDGSDASQDKELPPAVKGSTSLELGDWTVEPSATASELKLGVSYKTGAALKLGVTVEIPVQDLRVEGGVSIAGGLLGSPTFVIHGITGLNISLAAGVANGDPDNSKVVMEVPVELEFPIPPSPATGGLPMTVTVTFKFLVATALSGKNSTLVAAGRYGLSGPLGVRAGEILAPEFTVEQSIIDSISGIAIGPSGIVIAVKAKVQVGIGPPGFTAGPYASLTESIGLTTGSALGSPLATCRGATLELDVAGGASLNISSTAATALERLLDKGPKAEFGVEISQNVLSRSQVLPNVPLCQG